MDLTVKFEGIEFRPVHDLAYVFVSECGKVLSMAKSTYRPQILIPGDNGHGYKKICATNIQGKKVYRYVHRLVAHAWVPRVKRAGHPHINHKNGNKADNRASNLEWCDQKQNMAHARDVLGVNVGEKNHFAKAIPETIRKIRIERASGARLRDLSKQYGLTEGAISLACSGKTWRHIV